MSMASRRASDLVQWDGEEETFDDIVENEERGNLSTVADPYE